MKGDLEAAELALKAGDYSQAEARAALAAVREARRGISAAWASTVVNALVVMVALFIPAWERSADSIEKQLVEKRVLGMNLFLAINLYGELHDKFDTQNHLLPTICTLTTKAPAPAVSALAADLKLQREMYAASPAEPTSMIAYGQLVAPFATYSAELARLSTTPPYNEQASREARPLLERLKRDECNNLAESWKEGLARVRASILEMDKAYRVPIRRTFGVLDGDASFEPANVKLDGKTMTVTQYLEYVDTPGK